MRLDRLVLAGLAATSLEGGSVQAAYPTHIDAPPAVELREDEIHTVSRLMNEVMHGWGAACRLSTPPLRTQAEREIYARAEKLLYDVIIPFVADFDNALVIVEHLKDPSEDVRKRTHERVREVIPALGQFLRLRQHNPAIVCLIRTQKRKYQQ